MTLMIQEKPEGVAFRVFVQPRSSKNMVSGLHGDALKIRLTAPPVDGAANKMCLQFMSKTLGVSKSSLEILSGHTSRTKLLLVVTEDKKKMKEKINALFAVDANF